MKNVAITGISGYIGTRLLNRLSSNESVKKIIGIDTNEPLAKSDKLKFYHRDILKPFGDLFTENKVDSAIHLAFILRPTRDRAKARRVDISGTKNFLKACKKAKVKHILYLSSHTVYGAHPDNPVPITEDLSLRPVTDFQYSRDKAEVEKAFSDFITAEPDINVTILRCCPVIGPNAIGSAPTILFKPPLMIAAHGFDPPMQFVHEDDLIRLIEIVISRKKPGVFNVAGDGELRYSEVARMAGKRMIALPVSLLEPLIRISWALHLQNESPPSGLEFIKYMPFVSTEKLKKETGFKFKYSSRQALSAFVAALRNK